MFLKKARLRDRKWFVQITALSFCLTAGAFVTVGSEAAAQTNVAYVVQSDRGGWIGQRSKEIRSLRASGQAVELLGTCISACTMYLSLPNACVGANAIFGFHGPSRNGRALPERDFDHWSRVMADNYSEPLKTWYMNEGRFRISGYYQISGAQLISLGYRQC